MKRFTSKINIVTDKHGEMIICLFDDSGKVINHLSGYFRKGKEKECKAYLKQLRKDNNQSKGMFYTPNLTDILNA